MSGRDPSAGGRYLQWLSVYVIADAEMHPWRVLYALVTFATGLCGRIVAVPPARAVMDAAVNVTVVEFVEGVSTIKKAGEPVDSLAPTTVTRSPAASVIGDAKFSCLDVELRVCGLLPVNTLGVIVLSRRSKAY